MATGIEREWYNEMVYDSNIWHHHPEEEEVMAVLMGDGRWWERKSAFYRE